MPTLPNPRGGAFGGAFGQGRLQLMVKDVTGPPSGTPPVGGPYVARDRLTGNYYAFVNGYWFGALGSTSPTVLQVVGTAGGSGAQPSITLPQAVTPNNKILYVTSRASTPTGDSPSCTGVTFQRVISNIGPANGCVIEVWLGLIAAGANNVIQSAWTGGNWTTIWAMEVKDLAGIQTDGPTAKGATEPSTTNSLNLAQPYAGKLAIASWKGGTGGGATATPPAGWTTMGNASTDGNACYKITPPISSISAAFSVGTSAGGVDLLAIFI